MIDKIKVEQIAQLARLKISEQEAELLSEQLSKVFTYFEEIAKIDTTNVEPLVTPVDIDSFPREDIVKNEISVEEMLSNAPDKVGRLFKVPPVI